MSSVQTKWAGIVFALLFFVAMIILNVKVKADNHHYFEQKLSLLGSLRKSALESYLETVKGELSFWVESELLEQVSREIDAAWYALPGDHKNYLRQRFISDNPHPRDERWKLYDANDGTAYSKAHLKVHELAHNFVEERGYHDFLLIDLQGNIIYTVDKGDDFGENLLQGKLKTSPLAAVYKQAMADHSDFVHFADFAPYAPNANQPTVFIARRMHDVNNQPSGVVAIELDTTSIMKIMKFDQGMGESGETYLVGSDLLMRSDSRFSEHSTVLKTKVDTSTVRKALDGESGIATTPDYRGIDVLSAYDYIDIGKFRWALMAEIDEQEIADTNPVSAVSIAITAFFTYLIGLVAALAIGRFEGTGDQVALDMIDDI